MIITYFDLNGNVHCETIETLKMNDEDSYSLFYVSNKLKKICERVIPNDSVIAIHSDEDLGKKFFNHLVSSTGGTIQVCEDNEDKKYIN